MHRDDISAAAARSLLTPPAPNEQVVGAWSRRRFLSAVALGVGAGLTLGSLGQELLGHELPDAWAGPPIGANDGILVNIFLYGGNDGLNTVVPYTNGAYYDWRTGGTSIAPGAVLPLDASFGLHPALSSVKGMWDAGQVAIVHGVATKKPQGPT